MNKDVATTKKNVEVILTNKNNITSIKNSIFETVTSKNGISRRRVSRETIRKYAIVDDSIE